jgi:hypothetical protein
MIGENYIGVTIITPVLSVPMTPDKRITPILFECGEMGIARPARSVTARAIIEKKNLPEKKQG